MSVTAALYAYVAVAVAIFGTAIWPRDDGLSELGPVVYFAVHIGFALLWPVVIPACGISFFLQERKASQ